MTTIPLCCLIAISTVLASMTVNAVSTVYTVTGTNTNSAGVQCTGNSTTDVKAHSTFTGNSGVNGGAILVGGTLSSIRHDVDFSKHVRGRVAQAFNLGQFHDTLMETPQ